MLKSKIKVDTVPGFEVSEESNDIKDEKGSKKKKKASGGFHAMGLSFPIIKGITKRGYKQPTPIQRKTIPLALEDKDLVAMARTGSGKTACFVLPILEKLTSPIHKTTPGKSLRALIVSPTRELALQTLRFVRDLGKYTGLTSAAILGGESIEQQFSVMSGSVPDIVVATPGRFLHICVEMSLQLNNIQVVVFDEADRLFELGFGEQLQEIVARLPSNRQTLLFSATLPKMLVEFAKAGLSEPVLIRLDVDWKLPSALWLGWIYVRSELKTAALLLLLDKVLTPKTPQAVVFVATKHHVEYLNLILQKAGISSSYAYSGLDPSARKIALGRFTTGACSVLLVTDVAARGLDLPALDTVINYHFPAKPKLFVHRVGRTARAGRAGRAFSLVCSDDLAHLLDLQLFLGTSLINVDKVTSEQCPSGVFGGMPVQMLEMRHQDVITWEKTHSEIEDAARVCGRGWQQYLKWREVASAANNTLAKTITPPLQTHPALTDNQYNKDTEQIIQQICNYTPKGTILELTAKNDSAMYLAMKAKRQAHGKTIQKVRNNKETKGSLQDDLLNNNKNETCKKKKETVRDENYIPHQPSDQHTEMGMAVNFVAGASAAELEMRADCGDDERKQRGMLKWDRRRKKLTHTDDSNRKMIRTENGGRIPASYKSGRYQLWKKRNGAYDDVDVQSSTKKPASEFRPHWVKHNERAATKRANVREHADKHRIVKERLRKEKIKAKLKHKLKHKKKRK